MRASEAFDAIRGMLWLWQIKEETPYPAVRPSIEELTRDGIFSDEDAEEYLEDWDQDAEDRSVLFAHEQARAARFIHAMLTLNPEFEISDAALRSLPRLGPPGPQAPPRARLRVVERVSEES